ncbi:MAG TPA: hypothetical protein VGR62_04255 [Candidatus Binatia bacterium]|nr:hypothetical protein [Candidatus Binatia bacterium]
MIGTWKWTLVAALAVRGIVPDAHASFAVDGCLSGPEMRVAGGLTPFGSSGGTQTVTLEMWQCNRRVEAARWKVSTPSQWIHLSPKSGVGVARVEVRVDANKAAARLSSIDYVGKLGGGDALITASGGVRVTQDAAPPPPPPPSPPPTTPPTGGPGGTCPITYEITPGTTFGPDGGSGSLNVRACFGGAVAAVHSSADWIVPQAASVMPGAGTGFIVRPNYAEQRKATLKVGTKSYTITQAARRPFGTFLEHATTPLGAIDHEAQFLVRDWDRDGIADVVYISKQGTGSGTTEVHVLSGASRWRQFVLHSTTYFGETDGRVQWDMLDWNRDGVLDLIAVVRTQTGSGRTEVHVLDGAGGFQTFLLHAVTAYGPTDDRWDWEFTDWNRDGVMDLVAIIKSQNVSGAVDVHVFDGVTGFQTWLFAGPTPFGSSDDRIDFSLVDWDGDGTSDLVSVIKRETGSGQTEVHVLSGASGFTQWLLHAATWFGPTDARFAFGLARVDRGTSLDLVTIITAGTGSGGTEVHVLDGSR